MEWLLGGPNPSIFDVIAIGFFLFACRQCFLAYNRKKWPDEKWPKW